MKCDCNKLEEINTAGQLLLEFQLEGLKVTFLDSIDMIFLQFESRIIKFFTYLFDLATI